MVKDTSGTSFTGCVNRKLGSKQRPKDRSHSWQNWKADKVCWRDPLLSSLVWDDQLFPTRVHGPPTPARGEEAPEALPSHLSIHFQSPHTCGPHAEDSFLFVLFLFLFENHLCKITLVSQ